MSSGGKEDERGKVSTQEHPASGPTGVQWDARKEAHPVTDWLTHEYLRGFSPLKKCNKPQAEGGNNSKAGIRKHQKSMINS